MTVAAKNPIEVYSGDGVTTAFAARWRYINTASLKVELISSSGAVTAQTLGVHYTATAGTTDAGGTVTMVTPPAVGQRLRIKRVTPRSQPTQYPTSGAFPASSHELALDRTMMAVQELGVDVADVQGRALQVPDGETIAKLPAASSRIGKMFAFDGSGNGVFDIDADKVRDIIGAVFNPIFTTLASLVMFLQVGVGAIVRSVQDKLREKISVKDFGAKGDGVTDDTAAFQRAVDFCIAYPGHKLILPRGGYVITDTLNNTYAGEPAGLDSGYYGFTVEGEDQLNTYIIGKTAGKPVWDLTGKPRMTFRNIGFANYTDGAHNPSCMLLLARNRTNNFAGGHVFERMNFRGYCTQTLVQTASSEVNRWINVDFEAFGTSSGLELTDQILTTVNSPYIDLTGHVFSGGNTRHVFIGCTFNGSVVPSGPHYVRCAGIDNSMFIGCYSHFGNGVAEFLFSGSCTNITFQDHRGEGSADYHIRLAAGVSIRGLTYSGRSSAPIRGEDNSVFEDSEIRSTFMALGGGVTAYSFDAWDALDCDIYDLTNGGRVRNSARGSRFWDYKVASAWSLPTGDLTQPQFYGLSYTGGSANYRRRTHTQSKWERNRIGRQEINTLVLPETHVSNLSAANYASGYTPDLDVGSNFSFIVTGNATVNAPSNFNLGPGDPAGGQVLILSFSQDATGGYTVTLPSAYDLQGVAIPTAPLSRVSLMFVCTNTSGGQKWMRVN